MNPKVTVLMPVYNGARYLTDAVGSVLGQDFTDFELLIIDDGSVDSSVKVIESYADPRIRLLKNGKNRGLVMTLNRGLEEAKGEYIARMDCDDICIRSRLSSQVRFMEKNKNLGACGSFYYLLRNGKKVIADFPVSNEEIKAYLVFNSPMAHPSVMIRRSVIGKHNLKYDPDFIHCEDYDLWSRLAEYSELGNCPEILLEYRVHEGQITGNEKFFSAKAKSLDTIRTRELGKIGIIPTPEELRVHNIISNGEKPATPELFQQAESWLEKLLVQNEQGKKLNKGYFEKIILERWLRLCYNHLGWKKGFRYFYGSAVYRKVRLPIVLKLALFRQVFYSYKRKKQG
ncbi:MAG: glycosyltransferase family 2 protein [Bacteroidia bacterium]